MSRNSARPDVARRRSGLREEEKLIYIPSVSQKIELFSDTFYGFPVTSNVVATEYAKNH
jgi:hypothetical protein